MSKSRATRREAAGGAVEMRSAAGGAPSLLAWIAGIVFLSVSVGASAILGQAALLETQPPGCGPESGCAAATNSVWGKIPGIEYPVSLLGLAFFAGLLVAWIMSRRGVSIGVKSMARVGAAASAFFIVVMVATGLSCPYCIAAHIGSVLFWLTVEITGRPSAVASGRPFAAAQAGFAVLTLIFASLWWWKLAAETRQAEEDLSQSTTNIIEQSGASAAGYSQDLLDIWEENGGFRGRYLHGPEVAPIRIVIFSDYQCPDCFGVHEQLSDVLEARDDIAFTAKHFPMCWDCNQYMPRNMHPDACYAARVAEAAGMTWGAEGFWNFHNWLFEARRGAVSDQVLFERCRELGYGPEETVAFISLAKHDSTSAWPVTQDIEEGVALGLQFTPMIFINGVELKGWKAPNALERAIERIAASNPQPAPMGSDRPVTASQKVIEDWRDQDPLVVLPDNWPHTQGNAGGAISMIVFGDYEDDTTAELDKAIRDRINEGEDIEYAFRHFPGNQECNPGIVRSPHLNACTAARAAEAAGTLEGEEGYWRMHDWLFEHQSDLSEDAILAGAGELGFDPEPFLAAMQADEAELAIRQDAQAGRVLVQRATLPILVLNGRRVPWWKYQGQWLLDELLAAAPESRQ